MAKLLDPIEFYVPLIIAGLLGGLITFFEDPTIYFWISKLFWINWTALALIGTLIILNHNSCTKNKRVNK